MRQGNPDAQLHLVGARLEPPSRQEGGDQGGAYRITPGDPGDLLDRTDIQTCIGVGAEGGPAALGEPAPRARAGAAEDGVDILGRDSSDLVDEYGHGELPRELQDAVGADVA